MCGRTIIKKQHEKIPENFPLEASEEQFSVDYMEAILA
jgi:hypothetical protein